MLTDYHWTCHVTNVTLDTILPLFSRVYKEQIGETGEEPNVNRHAMKRDYHMHACAVLNWKRSLTP